MGLCFVDFIDRKVNTMKAFKKILLCILVIVFVVLINTTSWSQGSDIETVQFTDGTVVTGVVVEINNEIIRIKTDDGTIVTRKFNDIAAVMDEKEVKALAASNETGTLFIPKHTFQIGPEISYIKYSESSLNVEETGVMYGIDASYAYHDGVMLKGEVGYSFGYMDYKGSGEADNIEDTLLEMRVLAGYDFFLNPASVITPYVGFGYRHLSDNGGGKLTSTGYAGYDRKTQYYYIPVGIRTNNDAGNGWSWGITAEFDYFCKGKQTSCLSDVDPGYNDVENKQKDGHGFRGSFIVQKKGETISYSIEPFIRYWKIDDSETATVTYYGVPDGYAWEPQNNSTQFGIMLTVMF